MSNNKTIYLTASQVRAYKACRRLYQLQYIDCLKPVNEYEPYATGRNYHAKISQIIKTGKYEKSFDKTDAMADAFGKYILPKLQPFNTEREFKKRLSYGIYLKGKIDGWDKNGVILEHKTTSASINDDFEDKLKWDDQIYIYMIGLDANELIYTVCRKPTIKLKQNETEEDYLKRCAEWYDESKTAVFKITKTSKELQDKKEELISIAKEIRAQKNWHKNSSNCKVLACLYEDICLGYDSENMPGFEKKEKINEELSI